MNKQQKIQAIKDMLEYTNQFKVLREVELLDENNVVYAKVTDNKVWLPVEDWMELIGE